MYYARTMHDTVVILWYTPNAWLKTVYAYLKYVWKDNVMKLVVRMEEGLRSGAQSESSCSASTIVDIVDCQSHIAQCGLWIVDNV